MAYTPTVWQNGDVITAEKLNNIENGIENSNSTLIVTEDSEYALDKTYTEIKTAINNGTPVYVKTSFTENTAALYPITTVAEDGGSYGVGGITIDITTFEPTVIMFITDSENGYPVESNG